MLKIFDTFYKKLPSVSKQLYLIGQFYEAPVGYILQQRAQRLRVDYYNPDKPHNSNYIFENTDLYTFDPSKNKDGFREKTIYEFFLAIKHKFRPVVILSTPIAEWRDYGVPYKDCYVVAPTYSLRDRSESYKFTEEFILRVQACEYPALFYLPKSEEFNVAESIIRLDRILTLPKEILRPCGNKAMTDEFKDCLMAWVWYFLGGSLDEDIQAYRDLALESLRATLS